MSETNKMKCRILQEQRWQQEIMAWWEKLKENRGAWAELRRCHSLDEVIGAKSTIELSFNLDDLPDYIWKKHPEVLACVAGLLAHIKEFSSLDFGTQLGGGNDEGSQPALSERRFKQLLESRSPEDFYKAMRRVLKILGNRANPVLVADDILRWALENRSDLNVAKSLKFHWAYQYYSSQLKPENKKGK